jgi:hypothetical protein
MREKKLAMRASGSDRVSEELLTMTLHRRDSSLVDDPTSTLFSPTGPTSTGTPRQQTLHAGVLGAVGGRSPRP